MNVIKHFIIWLCPWEQRLNSLEKRVTMLDGELQAARRLCAALSADLSRLMSVEPPADPQPRVRIARTFTQFREAATLASQRKGN